ncbi:MAG: UvrD/REP helicase [Ilumatobacteraceae bacterium]|nr:UvrD/REP helicase [Ilumatobacteraceae bacterium]
MTLFDFLDDEPPTGTEPPRRADGPGEPREPREPADQMQRRRIEVELDRTLFVEAGAGSGKSTALVGRVIELVTAGRVPLRDIAAITFTEKAAAELRDKIRQRLETTSEQARTSGDDVVVEQCATAIDQLDGAAIGTLHAFAQRILAEHPIEVQLPPRLDILDEVTSDVQFEARWRAFLDALLDDPAMERTLLLLFGAGVKPPALRALALEFDRNWDLVAERVPVDAPEPPPLRAQVLVVLDALDRTCRRIDECTKDDDTMVARLGAFAAWSAALRDLDDEIDLLEELSGAGALTRPSFRVKKTGRATSWTCDINEVRAELDAVETVLEQVRGEVAQACAHRIAAALRTFTVEAANARREAGQLAFHDLLVLARRLVSTNAPARQRLHERYRRLLLDEFQDTDPIQIEIAVRIAADDPRSEESGALPWDQVEVTPGQLFFVGDPKQSIYRFRRADVSLFLEASRRYGGREPVRLTTNFRTGAEIIDWVNHTFGRLLAEAPAVDTPVPSQPAYVDLTPWRTERPGGPAVSVIGRTPLSQGTAGELREAEARQVAAAIVRIRSEGWTVEDRTGGWKPAALGDITVLVPARTSLPFLETELERAGIPYRAESSSLVYVSRAVRDLLMALRAVDDPSDHLAVVSALRSPLFACGDDDLYRHKVEQHGHWNHAVSQPATVEDGPVLAALSYLGGLHRDRHWTSPAELADRLARDRRVFELGFAEGRTRDVWRRLRFVIDQAREWGEATDGSLREYLQWVTRQSAEGSRVAEAVLPESDDDAVRIMTIHAAKGLEFPITIVSGMSTAPMGQRAAAQVVFPPLQPDGTGGGVGYRFGKHVTTDVFEDWIPIDDQMAFDERVRLLYVATTRAKDHLVVSLQRKTRKSAVDPTRRTNAELLVDGIGPDRLDTLPDAVEDDIEAVAVALPDPPSLPAPFAEWRAELDAALAAGSRPTTVAATALTAEGTPDPARDEIEDTDPADGVDDDAGSVVVDDPAEAGLHKRPRDLDLPPWLKGRYGTAVGRAVHGTLQTIDLADPAGLGGAVAAQCEAEAIPDRTAEVAELVRAALASPVIAAATAGPYWREVYACTPTAGGRLLEGYIDLLYRTVDGMVIVDYKTAATNDPLELQRRVDGYRLQGGSYALAVRETTGEPIARVVFAFLTPGGAVELELADVEAAVGEVEALVAAGAEQVTA